LPTDNFILSDVTIFHVKTALNMESGNFGGPSEGLGEGLKRIFINNLTVDSEKWPFSIQGQPGSPVESVVLNNVRIMAQGGITAKQADGYSINPCSGFCFRNVKHVELHNVRVDFKEQDARAPLIAENVGELELDHFAAPDVPEGFSSYVLDHVGKLVVNGQEARTVAPRIRGLEVNLSRTGGKAVVGEPFDAMVTAENPGPEGLAKVEIRWGEETVAKSVWLKGTRRILFAGLKCSAPGEHPVEAGAFRKSVLAVAAPVAQPVTAPYLTFANVKADFARRGEGFALQADGDFILERHDQYGAIYQKQSLGQNAVITVKVDKEDPVAEYGGRAGIMVRNDISQPGQSPGYVVLAASLFESNGWAMEWDANGDGRIDHHSVFGGYTLWPYWLKLERRGAKYTGYYSLDGETWTKVAEVEVPGSSPVQDAGAFVSYGRMLVKEMKITDLAAPAGKP
jgi:hypothetical protein